MSVLQHASRLCMAFWPKDEVHTCMSSKTLHVQASAEVRYAWCRGFAFSLFYSFMNMAALLCASVLDLFRVKLRHGFNIASLPANHFLNDGTRLLLFMGKPSLLSKFKLVKVPHAPCVRLSAVSEKIGAIQYRYWAACFDGPALHAASIQFCLQCCEPLLMRHSQQEQCMLAVRRRDRVRDCAGDLMLHEGGGAAHGLPQGPGQGSPAGRGGAPDAGVIPACSSPPFTLSQLGGAVAM